jgi:hypothetical protein
MSLCCVRLVLLAPMSYLGSTQSASVSFYGGTEPHNSIFCVVVRLDDVWFPYVDRGSYLPVDNIAAIAYWYKTVLNGHW